MNLYFISGLGADERIFGNLEIPEGYHVYYLKWINPLSSKEQLNLYCYRLSEQIDLSRPFILIGLSFGGMVARALNDIIKPEKTILLSSIAVRKELPYIYKLGGFLGITNILPVRPPRFLMKILKWYMGTEAKEDEELVDLFIEDSEPSFIRWAMYQAANWAYTSQPGNLYQIHGTKDRIFPVGLTNAQYEIPEGGHFMVLNKAKEVSAILKDILALRSDTFSKI